MVEEVTEGVVTDSGAAVGAENKTTIIIDACLSQMLANGAVNVTV